MRCITETCRGGSSPQHADTQEHAAALCSTVPCYNPSCYALSWGHGDMTVARHCTAPHYTSRGQLNAANRVMAAVKGLSTELCCSSSHPATNMGRRQPPGASSAQQAPLVTVGDGNGSCGLATQLVSAGDGNARMPWRLVTAGNGNGGISFTLSHIPTESFLSDFR
jgi:hypothetical protein